MMRTLLVAVPCLIAGFLLGELDGGGSYSRGWARGYSSGQLRLWNDLQSHPDRYRDEPRLNRIRDAMQRPDGQH